MKVVYLTAGAAGMFCGSCMHDNALAKALRGCGIDCLLQPVYTPIRTDEESVATQQVFLGGIQVYLLQQMPWLRYLPKSLRHLVDFPPLIRWATRRAGATDPALLGNLAVSMLRGEHGHQAKEFQRLEDWIVRDVRPDVVILTNLLIGGGLSGLRKHLPGVKIVVMLQGDDIFLDHLPEASRSEAIRLCAELVPHVDRFCVHSDFYGQKMGALLQIPAAKLVRTPLSIDLAPFSDAGERRPVSDADVRLGYLARIAPEKGLHRLVEAFERIAPDHPQLTLHAAGWLGPANEAYLESIHERLLEVGLQDRFVYHGSPDLQGKIRFLRDVDVLSVPTEYEDPKGLFVLEALAAGTPVVMPDHGAFGELVRSTGGGVLVPPDNLDALCRGIIDLVNDPQRRQRLAEEGRDGVRSRHSIQASAEELARLIGQT
ncbi:glycosyltransferase family 4 protein [Roseiconus nitratireducens]|uniref:Glycosyltransferase family 4 protein n=1 Tax=Roseiconus nitratireducens TaxID=2605748 RepID=A0A5M6D133_9BACT|nr:glycosyltransferase family 4 protein [Roseiconus nitratireducens]KAA5539329.1 glycosyltransferase family 4 protein [Roseiconus nitratireducens]